MTSQTMKPIPYIQRLISERWQMMHPLGCGRALQGCKNPPTTEAGSHSTIQTLSHAGLGRAGQVWKHVQCTRRASLEHRSFLHGHDFQSHDGGPISCTGNQDLNAQIHCHLSSVCCPLPCKRQLDQIHVLSGSLATVRTSSSQVTGCSLPCTQEI